jgi:hypothetical protein
VREMAGLVAGHGWQGPCIMGHVDRLFHRSRAGSSNHLRRGWAIISRRWAIGYTEWRWVTSVHHEWRNRHLNSFLTCRKCSSLFASANGYHHNGLVRVRWRQASRVTVHPWRIRHVGLSVRLSSSERTSCSASSIESRSVYERRSH